MGFKKILGTSILAASLLLSPLVATANNWTEFRSPDGFTVSLPGQPKMTTSDDGTPVGKVHTNVYFVHTGKADYTVAVTTIPGLAMFLGGGRVYSEARKQFLKTNTATEVSFGPSTFAGHKCKELVYTNDSSEGRCEMFMVGHRLYCVDANHLRGSSPGENQAFFSSFHLMPNVAAGE
jgi:hypothetical protein